MEKKALFLNFSKEPFRQLKEGVSTRFISGKGLMLAEHHVEKGYSSQDETHVNEQLTWVQSGKLRMTVNGEIHLLGPGDAVLIPSNAPHKCEVLEKSVVYEVFSPPRDEWL